MKAMIFAAGLGTRLKPFTDFHPKALAPIGGEPILGIVLSRLIDVGVSEFVINIHHFGQQIIDYLASRNNFGVTIHISDERDLLLETGGGILKAAKWLDDDDFIVHNADILTDFDLGKMINFHIVNNSSATLLADKRQTRRYLVADGESMRMIGWTDISTGKVKPAGLEISQNCELLAFGGVHIFSPQLLPKLSDYAATLTNNKTGEIPKFSIMDFYINVCGDSNINLYRPAEQYSWFDIGKPESLEAARQSKLCNK